MKLNKFLSIIILLFLFGLNINVQAAESKSTYFPLLTACIILCIVMCIVLMIYILYIINKNKTKRNNFSLYCPFCGGMIDSKRGFCTRCGNELPKNNSKTGSKAVLIILIAAAAVLVVTNIIIIGVIKSGDKKDNNTYITPAPTSTAQITAAPKATNAVAQSTAAPSTPIPTANNRVKSGGAEKAAEYRRIANGIEDYDRTHFQTANNQHQMNTESQNVYQKWDNLLNEIYQYLKETLPASQFESLKNDEISWIKRKDNAIEDAGREWEGGSGEPMARNCAGTKYTRERCYYLISLIEE